MHYELWSHGRVLGQTDLGYAYRENGFRCGDFHPTEVGHQLMRAATGVRPALRAAYENPLDPTADDRVMAAMDDEAALALELRRSDGVLIETEDITVVDTEYLLSLQPDESLLGPLTAEQEAEVDAMVAEWRAESGDDEPWRSRDEGETELPRYQLQVRLLDHNDVP
jgi:hypothetical protein